MTVPEGWVPHDRASPLTALADNAMGLSLAARLGEEGRPATSIVTTSLGVDFVASAECGQWLEIDPVVIHAGGGQGVVQALARADGKVIARANATFRFRHEHIDEDT